MVLSKHKVIRNMAAMVLPMMIQPEMRIRTCMVVKTTDTVDVDDRETVARTAMIMMTVATAILQT
eukprot:9456148-Alexandrium_andersonii.AAC.1